MTVSSPERASFRQFIHEHQRWLIVLLLFFVSAVNSLDRQALSVLFPTLRDTLHFGPVEYSYITTAFLFAYTLGYSFCGTVLDRVGIKVGLAIALAFWSIAGMFHAIATGWIMLMIFRFMLGLGESFNSPAGVKAIAEWAPLRERGLSMAVVSNGNVLGAILAPPLVSYVAAKFGWQWAFIVTGAIGFILLIAWWRYYESPEKHPFIGEKEKNYIAANRPAAAALEIASSRWQLLLKPSCLGLILGRLMTDWTTFFYSFWMVDYLTHSRGFSLAMIGLVAWIPFVAADIGGPGGGAMSDWLVRRGWNSSKARLTLMFGAACLMPLASVTVRTDITWLCIALLAVLLGSQSCWMANQLTLISETVPRKDVATLLALSAMAGSIGGLCTQGSMGHIIEKFGYFPIFTALSVTHLLGFGIILLSRSRIFNRPVVA